MLTDRAKVMTDEPTHHPVQNDGRMRRAPIDVTMRAYEVHCALYGEQKALVTGGCRGGFSVGELIAFLYARSFPKAEWRERFEEALRKGEGGEG